MGDETLLEYLHFELVDYCVNEKKVSSTLRNYESFNKLSNFRTVTSRLIQQKVYQHWSTLGSIRATDS